MEPPPPPQPPPLDEEGDDDDMAEVIVDQPLHLPPNLYSGPQPYRTVEEENRIRERFRRQEHQRLAEHHAQEVAAAEAAGTVPPPHLTDLRLHCFFCRQGVLSVDAGEGGTAVFQELVRLTNFFLASWSAEAVADLARRFYQDRLAPLFVRAGREPPPFHYEAVLEHFSTNIHTCNPRLMRVQELRKIRHTVLSIEDRCFDRQTGKADPKMLEQLERHRKQLLSYMRADPSKMPDHEPVDGDILPEAMAYLSPAAGMMRHRRDVRDDTLGWLKDYLSAPPPASSASPSLPPPTSPTAPSSSPSVSLDDLFASLVTF